MTGSAEKCFNTSGEGVSWMAGGFLLLEEERGRFGGRESWLIGPGTRLVDDGKRWQLLDVVSVSLRSSSYLLRMGGESEERGSPERAVYKPGG